MDNNNKDSAIQQALDFVNNLDDTLPVEVINDNAQVLTDLERITSTYPQARIPTTGSGTGSQFALCEES